MAGPSGTHVVCVCSQHQNIKLKSNSLTTKISYRDLLGKCVCSMEERSCMMHKGDTCPGKEAIVTYLQSKNWIGNRTSTTYNNWTSVNQKGKDSESPVSRAVLHLFDEPIDEFTKNFVEDVWNLCEHHFVAEEQKNYLSHCKKKLATDTCIAIMDFLENYTFICQDSIQAFYFSSIQATLHPIVIYYKTITDTTLKVMSFCVISDSSKHTACTVNIFQLAVIKKFKEICPWITNIIYFSDGAPTQYKNKWVNILINLINFIKFNKW